MAVVGRANLDHPALGTAGGTALHSQIETIYTNVSNHMGARYYSFSAVGNATPINITHGFGGPFADLDIAIYTGTYPSLTLIESPEDAAAPWTIAAGGTPTTQITVTTPVSGGPHSGIIMVYQKGAYTRRLRTDAVYKRHVIINTGTSLGQDTKLVYCTGASAFTVTLPSAATAIYREIEIKSLATANITVSGTLDAGSSTILAPLESIRLHSNGSQWNVMRMNQLINPSESASVVSNTLTPATARTTQRITTGTALNMIAGPISDKTLILFNETGVDLVVGNDTGATAANRIYTGTGADAILKNQAAIEVQYNSTLSRWVIIGAVAISALSNPMTTLGDTIYGAASGTPTRLAGNIATNKKVLSQTGNGSVSAPPVWSDDYGRVPIGSIVPYAPGYFGAAANGGGWTVSGPSANTVAAVKTYLAANNSDWWACDGTAPNDSASPIFNTSAKFVPDLTGNRFIMGATTAGTAAGNANNQFQLAITNLPLHDHGAGTYATSLSGTFASSTHTHDLDTATAKADIAVDPNSVYARRSANTFTADRFVDGVSAGTGTFAGRQGSRLSGNTASPSATASLSGSNSVTGTSGQTGSGTAFSILPLYLQTFYIIRIK